ncbi:hypothetical protein PCE1_003370 [Barthelona sp. PCE]
MGKKSKIGKHRLDKYYFMAKEQGYRSRAAFKLLQLNNKYNFLQNSRVIVDLCAAPGGWSQVAAQFAAKPSMVVAVDLDKIQPIKGVISMQQDITTEACRRELKTVLKGAPVDVVLNDGAPNVGASWEKDAIIQAELCLEACRFAADTLRPGGCFVTKIFRSSHYNSLLWVFNALFDRVSPTKPPSSRSESAEIFVVCEGYKAPDSIDPRFFNAADVFKDTQTPEEVEQKAVQALQTFIRSGKRSDKANRKGYLRNDALSLFQDIPAIELIIEPKPLQVLVKARSLTFKDDISKHLLSYDVTTEEVLECCKDIKVLNRKDFRSLLKWRKHLLVYHRNDIMDVVSKMDAPEEEEKEFGAPVKKEIADVHSDDDFPEEEEEERRVFTEEELLEKLLRKRKKKRAERLAKEAMRQKLGQHHHHDMAADIAETQQQELFSTRTGALNMLKRELQNEEDDIVVSDEEYGMEAEDLDYDDVYLRELEAQLDAGHQHYLARNEIRIQKQRKADEEMLRVPEGGMIVSDYEEESEEEEEFDNPIEKAEAIPIDANDFFNRSIFNEAFNENEDIDDVMENELMAESDDDEGLILQRKRGAAGAMLRIKKGTESDEDWTDDETNPVPEMPMKAQTVASSSLMQSKAKSFVDEKMWQPDKEAINEAEFDSDEESEEEEQEEEFDDSDYDSDAIAERLALGQHLLRKKSRRELEDSMFNRFVNDDDPADLPEWFVQDEAKAHKPIMPVTKAQVDEIKQLMKTVDARPIKKVLEAKHRKKLKMERKIHRAQKRAEVISAAQDLSQGEKLRQITRLFRNIKGEKRETVYVPTTKSETVKDGGRIRSKPGKKVKFVDARMKNDVRAASREKTQRYGIRKRKAMKSRRKYARRRR